MGGTVGTVCPLDRLRELVGVAHVVVARRGHLPVAGEALDLQGVHARPEEAGDARATGIVGREAPDAGGGSEVREDLVEAVVGEVGEASVGLAGHGAGLVDLGAAASPTPLTARRPKTTRPAPSTVNFTSDVFTSGGTTGTPSRRESSMCATSVSRSPVSEDSSAAANSAG
jgi:hypothetical protein